MYQVIKIIPLVVFFYIYTHVYSSEDDIITHNKNVPREYFYNKILIFIEYDEFHEYLPYQYTIEPDSLIHPYDIKEFFVTNKTSFSLIFYDVDLYESYYRELRYKHFYYVQPEFEIIRILDQNTTIERYQTNKLLISKRQDIKKLPIYNDISLIKKIMIKDPKFLCHINNIIPELILYGISISNNISDCITSYIDDIILLEILNTYPNIKLPLINNITLESCYHLINRGIFSHNFYNCFEKFNINNSMDILPKFIIKDPNLICKVFNKTNELLLLSINISNNINSCILQYFSDDDISDIIKNYSNITLPTMDNISFSLCNYYIRNNISLKNNFFNCLKIIDDFELIKNMLQIENNNDHFIKDNFYEIFLQIKLNHNIIKIIELCIQLSNYNIFHYDTTIEIIKYLNQFNISDVKGIFSNILLNNGLLLEYIDNQVDNLSELAVYNNIYAFRFVKNKSLDLCYRVVIMKPYMLKYVENQTKELVQIAIMSDPSTIRFAKIKNEYIMGKLLNMDESYAKYVDSWTHNLCEILINKCQLLYINDIELISRISNCIRVINSHILY